ncbi:PQQ-dependent sugar dehydrogenase [Carnimonas bestiolae]|uniref:PQQ-dependent sugar dehydrogenase n=1 Tax=Carnimonas bestiolae TaxID=3402172 RepID=UPI003EDB7C3B
MSTRVVLMMLSALLTSLMLLLAPTARADEQQAQLLNAGTIEPNGAFPYSLETVVSLDKPWGIAFLNDGRALVTEKTGKLVLLDHDGQPRDVAGVPEVVVKKHNGLLAIALAPDFAKSHHLYLSYMAPAKEGTSRLTLTRFTLDLERALTLSNAKVIWQQSFSSDAIQPGGGITFSPDHRHLFFAVGDRARAEAAQDPDQPAGKLLRLHLDGSTPHSNPYAQEEGVRAQTWSLGHRNFYGMAFSPTGSLWQVEMGPQGGDELNLIKAGANYGWGAVSEGNADDGTPLPTHRTRPDIEAPRLYWTPAMSPSSLLFYSGDRYPEWKGSALITGLSGKNLWRVDLTKDNRIRSVEQWNLGMRLRAIAQAPDGALWILEDANPGKVMRITPKRAALQ